jgi:hypothetical protein
MLFNLSASAAFMNNFRLEVHPISILHLHNHARKTHVMFIISLSGYTDVETLAGAMHQPIQKVSDVSAC